MDRLSEIRARCEAVKAEKDKGSLVDCASLAYGMVKVDIPYLLAEVERLEMSNDENKGAEIMWRNRYQEAVARAEKAEASNHWIPVGERLPETRCDVLACAFWHETYQTLPAWYAPASGWHVDVGLGHKTDLSVTHWRPLPEPPEEGERGWND